MYKFDMRHGYHHTDIFPLVSIFSEKGQIWDLEFQKRGGFFQKLFQRFQKKGQVFTKDENNSIDNLYISTLIKRNTQSDCQQ